MFIKDYLCVLLSLIYVVIYVYKGKVLRNLLCTLVFAFVKIKSKYELSWCWCFWRLRYDLIKFFYVFLVKQYLLVLLELICVDIYVYKGKGLRNLFYILVFIFHVVGGTYGLSQFWCFRRQGRGVSGRSVQVLSWSFFGGVVFGNIMGVFLAVSMDC